MLSLYVAYFVFSNCVQKSDMEIYYLCFHALKKAKIVIDMKYVNSDTGIIDQKRNFCYLYSIPDGLCLLSKP